MVKGTSEKIADLRNLCRVVFGLELSAQAVSKSIVQLKKLLIHKKAAVGK